MHIKVSHQEESVGLVVVVVGGCQIIKFNGTKQLNLLTFLEIKQWNQAFYDLKM